MSTFSGNTRKAGLLAAAIAASGLVVACGSTAPTQPVAGPATTAVPAASTQPPAGGVSPGASSPGAAPPSATPTALPPAPPATGNAGLALCRTATLRITVDTSQANGGAGSAYYLLDFTNTSSAPCEMYGYPGVSFALAPTTGGRQVGAAAQRSSAFSKVAVRLAPGATAHAWVRVAVAGNYPMSACKPVVAGWLRVYPPGETVAGYVGHAFSACSSTSAAQLTILPVRPGQGLAGVTP
jgi:Protein of unknown function (DUF4232)